MILLEDVEEQLRDMAFFGNTGSSLEFTYNDKDFLVVMQPARSWLIHYKEHGTHHADSIDNAINAIREMAG